MTFTNDAAHGVDDGTAAFLAMLDRGRRAADADRPELAERLFRQVLKDARGTSAERLACSYIAKLCARQGRALEAFIAARRLADLSVKGGTPEDRAFAWTGVVSAIAELGDFTRLDAAVAPLEEALDAYDGKHSAALKRHLHRVRAVAAVSRDDILAASAEIVRAAPPVSDPVSAPPGEWREWHLVDARVEFALGRFERARAALTRARDVAAPLGTNALSIAFGEMRCARAIEGPKATIAPARRLLDLLAEPSASSFGTMHRIEIAHATGLVLHRVCGARDDARRAFDLAAAASGASFAELARCAGEGSHLTAEETSIIADFHERLISTRATLAAAAQSLLLELGAVSLPPPSTTLGLCVRCDRARLSNGSMLPFPTLARAGAVGSVAYGICDDCVGQRRP